jgi:hypothetical protein
LFKWNVTPSTASSPHWKLIQTLDRIGARRTRAFNMTPKTHDHQVVLWDGPSCCELSDDVEAGCFQMAISAHQ